MPLHVFQRQLLNGFLRPPEMEVKLARFRAFELQFGCICHPRSLNLGSSEEGSGAKHDIHGSMAAVPRLQFGTPSLLQGALKDAPGTVIVRCVSKILSYDISCSKKREVQSGKRIATRNFNTQDISETKSERCVGD